MTKEVVLLDFWPSAFGMRVRIALAEKGVEHEYKSQNLWDKDELLLKMNPVHKKIPVLVHNDKPICESLNIVEYIDEVWNNNNPLLPIDPYQRAQARFWADFIDNKIFITARKILITKGEEQDTAKKEIIQNLKELEQQLGDKPYFGGDTFGFVDIALVPLYSWFYAYGTAGYVKIRESCPKIIEWAERCMLRDSVAKSLPNEEKIYEYLLDLKQRHIIE